MMWQKDWVRFTPEKSLRVRNMQNKKICFEVSNPNERGLFRKPLDSMEYMSRSIINYEIYKNMI
jgi:hypothetical protein